LMVPVATRDLLHSRTKGGRTHGPFEKGGRPRGYAARGDEAQEYHTTPLVRIRTARSERGPRW
jgi:hypothetical protein